MALFVSWLLESSFLSTYDSILKWLSGFRKNMDDLSESGLDSTVPWARIFDLLNKYHNDTYRCIDEALAFDDQGKKDLALSKYNEVLTYIDKALALPLVQPSLPGLSWERAEIMVQKMRKTKKEILSRLADLQVDEAAGMSLPLQPPSYEEAMSIPAAPSRAGSAPCTYRELAEALSSLRETYRAVLLNFCSYEKVDEAVGEAEILFSLENVRLYFISPDGSVNASSEPDQMQIVHYSEDIRGNRPPAYLQIGNWIYPLVPGVSPCFRTNYRAFILPDIYSEVEGSAVGLILPEDADESVYELLEMILDGIILQIEEPSLSRSRREVRLAHSFVRGARWVSSKLVSGAERAGDFMNKSTPKLLQHIDQEEPKEIDPKFSKGIEVAKNVSGKAVQVTGFVAGKVGSATAALGRFLAPHIQKQGARVLTNTFKMDETEAKQKMENVLETTAGAVEAFSTVYGALEHSAHILGSNVANNTITIVQHKYGAQAGQAVCNTFATMGNMYVARGAIKRLKPKYVVKAAAKEAGKAVIEDQRKHLQEDSNNSSFSKDAFMFEHSD